MRENYRNSIASINKFPQFTTMNVIDGQAVLVIYASLIFCSLTIDNILNIIVLLILAGISIQMLTGNNGILTKASDAKTDTEKKEIIERVRLDVMGKIIEKNGENVTDAELVDILDDYFKNVPNNLTETTELTTKEKEYKILISEILSLENKDNVIDISNFYIQATGNKGYHDFPMYKIYGDSHGYKIFYNQNATTEEWDQIRSRKGEYNGEEIQALIARTRRRIKLTLYLARR